MCQDVPWALRLDRHGSCSVRLLEVKGGLKLGVGSMAVEPSAAPGASGFSGCCAPYSVQFLESDEGDPLAYAYSSSSRHPACFGRRFAPQTRLGSLREAFFFIWHPWTARNHEGLKAAAGRHRSCNLGAAAARARISLGRNAMTTFIIMIISIIIHC